VNAFLSVGGERGTTDGRATRAPPA
jgi:hypothetical protein